MKNANTYARKLAALLKRIKRRPPEPSTLDSATQLVISFLQWNCTRKKAAAAYARLMKGLVDNNDLRVSHTHEIVTLLGTNYPRSEERAARLHDALQEIFVREHTVALDHLATLSKKDGRAYLDSLPGMPPYVAARVMLLCFDGHAIPVDDHLAELLRGDGVVEPDAPIAEIESFLEHHVKAGDGASTHHALQCWADSRKPRDPAKTPPSTPAPPKRPTPRSPSRKK